MLALATLMRLERGDSPMGIQRPCVEATTKERTEARKRSRLSIAGENSAREEQQHTFSPQAWRQDVCTRLSTGTVGSPSDDQSSSSRRATRSAGDSFLHRLFFFLTVAKGI